MKNVREMIQIKCSNATGNIYDIYYALYMDFLSESQLDNPASILQELLEEVHYVEVALNEIPLFIRKGKCIPVAEAAECVAALDTENMQLLGYEGAEYTLYEDDGVHKDYDREDNYRVLKK